MNEPLEYLKKNRKKRKTLTTFLKGLSRRKVRGIDPLAQRMNKEAFQKIDCLQCANCCRVMTPTWKKTEVKRVAEHVGMTYDEYFKKHLYIDKTGDIMNKKTPCQHLAADNKCSIYEIRPKDCSGFPHTQSREFKLFIPETHIQNLSYCPATFYVVEKMFDKLNQKK